MRVLARLLAACVLLLTLTGQVCAATPTMIHRYWWQSNENFENGNAFKLRIDPAGSGNALILCMSFAFSAGRTITVTDDIGSNTWTNVGQTIDDTGNNYSSRCFWAVNVAANTSVITVTFDTALQGFQAAMSEWYNVATASPQDGSCGNAGTFTALVSGKQTVPCSLSFTPGTSGDLIYQYGIDTNFGPSLEGDVFADNNGVTCGPIAGSACGFYVGSGFTFLTLDQRYGGVEQYQVQSVAAAITPSYQLTCAGCPVSFNTIAFALKSAAAGTAPSPTATRIAYVYHDRVDCTAANATCADKVYMNTVGHGIVLSTAYSDLQEQLVSVSDNVNGAWTLCTGSNKPQFAYKTNTSPNNIVTVTVTIKNLGSSNLQFLIYDVVNLGAFDSCTSDNQNPSCTGSVPANCTAASNLPGSGDTNAGAPTITPTTSNGLVIATIGILTGPPDTMPSPSAGGTPVFDAIYYTGYTDLAPADSGDGYGHFYNSSTTTENWIWHDTVMTTGWFGAALAFKAPTATGGFFRTLLGVGP